MLLLKKAYISARVEKNRDIEVKIEIEIVCTNSLTRQKDDSRWTVKCTNTKDESTALTHILNRPVHIPDPFDDVQPNPLHPRNAIEPRVARPVFIRSARNRSNSIIHPISIQLIEKKKINKSIDAISFLNLEEDLQIFRITRV